ncbi:serine/threonine-protein kinase pim-2-like [Pseudoliparis swirei]|uniref:serine/threonine-protein kinase pim-2-like n=1 Tax=Pseudoliparis swirei TaxID=2059687 RepID=UPI0024BE6BC1|nr:serine/threonine-protein kinase pim-2-like [Pseudoliparis swirei]
MVDPEPTPPGSAASRKLHFICGGSDSRQDVEGPKREKKRRLDLEDTEQKDSRAEFEAKYQEMYQQLGAGGCGAVFAGYRREDGLPVAIKHIAEGYVFCKHVDYNGRELSIEVAVMLRLQEETSGPLGTPALGAPVFLLDWYNLDKELILVHERPVPCKDLLNDIKDKGGSLPEEEAKIILKQLVDAAVDLQEKHIFHQDIKVENILIETGSDIPRVRLIDFGLSRFVKKGASYRRYYGTYQHVPPQWYSCNQNRPGPTTVWQMGVVLFETLHTGEDFMTKRFMEKSLTISETLSENCQDFLRLCLMEDPKQRPSLKQLRRHRWLK